MLWPMESCEGSGIKDSNGDVTAAWDVAWRSDNLHSQRSGFNISGHFAIRAHSRSRDQIPPIAMHPTHISPFVSELSASTQAEHDLRLFG
jgi:hypothetical protein